MATVYRRVGGKKLTGVIARHRDVQNGLDRHSLEAGLKAEALLAAHHHDGDAEIRVETGNVDRYVILDDSRGLKAAMSIEFGRQPDAEGKGGMEGLFILHRATGLGGKHG